MNNPKTRTEYSVWVKLVTIVLKERLVIVSLIHCETGPIMGGLLSRPNMTATARAKLLQRVA